MGGGGGRWWLGAQATRGVRLTVGLRTATSQLNRNFSDLRFLHYFQGQSSCSLQSFISYQIGSLWAGFIGFIFCKKPACADDVSDAHFLFFGKTALWWWSWTSRKTCDTAAPRMSTMVVLVVWSALSVFVTAAKYVPNHWDAGGISKS